MKCVEEASLTENEGKLIGEARDISIGKAEGKAEEKLEIAKVLKRKGIDISIIAESTGLSEEEIRCL